MAGCCAVATTRSRKRPSAWGRMASRSYAGVIQRVAAFWMYTLKWLNQKSTITSWS